MVAIDPPIRLNGYPDEPIDSTEAAAEFIERHDGPFDVEGTDLIALLRGAETQASADAACQVFRQWADIVRCYGRFAAIDGWRWHLN
jgi:hypothetical protein